MNSSEFPNSFSTEYQKFSTSNPSLIPEEGKETKLVKKHKKKKKEILNSTQCTNILLHPDEKLSPPLPPKNLKKSKIKKVQKKNLGTKRPDFVTNFVTNRFDLNAGINPSTNVIPFTNPISSVNSILTGPLHGNIPIRTTEWKKTVEERLLYTEILKNIYKCLIKVIVSRELTLVYEKHNDWLNYREYKDVDRNSEECSKELQDAINFIYFSVNKALFLNLYVIFDENHHIITLNTIDSLVHKKYPKKKFGKVHDEIRELLERYAEKEAIKKIITYGSKSITSGLEVTNYINNLEKITLPEDSIIVLKDELTKYFPEPVLQNSLLEKETYFASLLQRMYPVMEARAYNPPPMVEAKAGTKVEAEAGTYEMPEPAYDESALTVEQFMEKLQMEWIQIKDLPIEESQKEEDPPKKDLFKEIQEMKLSVIPPKILIALYKEFIELDQLFLVIEFLINLPEPQVPYMQKIIILNFLKSVLVSHQRNQMVNEKKQDYYYPGSIVKNKLKYKERYTINIAYKIEPNNIDCIIPFLCEEIEFLSRYGHDILFEYITKPILVTNQIEKFISKNTIDGDILIEFIEYLSHDIKIHAAMAYDDIDSEKCTRIEKLKHPPGPLLYSDNLVSFVKKMFLIIMKQSAIKNIINDFFCVYNIFLNLCRNLFKLNDYTSSIAIYTALMDIKIEKIVKSNKFPKISHDLKEFSKYMNNIINDSCHEITSKMVECQKNNIFYIPYFSHLTSRIIHRIEEIDLNGELPQFEKIHLKSKEMNDLDQIFDDVRFRVQSLLKNDIKMRTNINYVIYLNSTIDIARYEKGLDFILNLLAP